MTRILAKKATRSGPRVTACIPHFRCRPYIRRAVQSLLNQTHDNLDIVVVNDGDPNPPWDELADVNDPRLIRFDLSSNYGPYFATEIALETTTAPYFLIQDADDWSAPNRIERLLSALQRDHSDLAVSAEPQFIETAQGSRVVDVRWRKASHRTNEGSFILHHRLTPYFKYRAPHHGLFRTSSLRAIGGYYAGLKISYDTLVPNLILMAGRISHIPEGLYFRLIRPGSLTHGSQTGVGTPNAKHELSLQQQLYQSCYRYYRLFLLGQITAPQLTASIRRVCATHVSPSDRSALAREMGRLARLLQFRFTH